MKSTELVIITHSGHDTPHREEIKRNNPDLKIHTYNSALTGESAWKNYDRNFRDFWRNFADKIESDFVLFLEWNVRANEKLDNYFEEVENQISVANFFSVSQENPQWWHRGELSKNEKYGLNTDFAIWPLSVALFPRKVLDALCDPKWDDIMADDIFGEARLPNILKSINFDIVPNPNIKRIKENGVVAEKGLFYPIVNKAYFPNKISVVVVAMNRNDRVVPCVESWLSHRAFDDIVLVDWSSEPNMKDDYLIKDLVESNSKINFIRVDGEPYFNLCRSYNLGIDKAKNQNVLKIDIDYVMKNPEFADYISALDLSSSFYSTFEPWPPKHYWPFEYWGLLLFNKDHFNKAGRYNEKLKGWGQDDQDMAKRLGLVAERKIMKRFYLNHVYHIPHGDDLRTANYEIKNKWASLHANTEILKNG